MEAPQRRHPSAAGSTTLHHLSLFNLSMCSFRWGIPPVEWELLEQEKLFRHKIDQEGCPVLLGALSVIIIAALVLIFWSVFYELRSSTNQNQYCLLLLVQNQEEYIEGLLREILWWRFLKGGRVEVIAMDWGSTDATPAILGKFAYPYRACIVLDLKQESNLNLAELAPYNCRERVIVCDLRTNRNLDLLRQQISRSLEKILYFSKEKEETKGLAANV